MKWEYDVLKAPVNVTLIGAYNNWKVEYYHLIKGEDGFWTNPNSNYPLHEKMNRPPDAWMIPTLPDNIPKKVRGLTKEDLLQLLKEFD